MSEGRGCTNPPDRAVCGRSSRSASRPPTSEPSQPASGPMRVGSSRGGAVPRVRPIIRIRCINRQPRCCHSRVRSLQRAETPAVARWRRVEGRINLPRFARFSGPHTCAGAGVEARPARPRPHEQGEPGPWQTYATSTAPTRATCWSNTSSTCATRKPWTRAGAASSRASTRPSWKPPRAPRPRPPLGARLPRRGWTCARWWRRAR